MDVLAKLARGASPFDDARSRHVAGRFGMLVFLASLATLFIAGIVGFIVIRWQLQHKQLWPSDLPVLPRSLWLSTLVLIVSSVTLHAAVRALRVDRVHDAARFLLFTTMLGFLFLLVQAWCWYGWLSAVVDRWSASDEYRLALTGFYVLTGVHALHVLGGLVPLSVLTVRARHGLAAAVLHGRVVIVALYWHFLDAVWLILFAVLMLLVR